MFSFTVNVGDLKEVGKRKRKSQNTIYKYIIFLKMEKNKIKKIKKKIIQKGVINHAEKSCDMKHTAE